ncbi:MAG: YceI family protein [Saprospiraceae bacterium]
MKNLILISFLFAVSFSLSAQDVWTLDKSHTRVGFTVTHHMISELDGNFKEYDAKITTTTEDFSDAVFEFSAKTASINTDFELRDGHLREADYFDVEKYPTLHFKSTFFRKIAGNEYKIIGDLTIKGITKSVELDLWLIGSQMNKRVKQLEIGVKATGKIKRLDYGIGDNLPLFNVSDQIDLRVLGEFRKTN